MYTIPQSLVSAYVPILFSLLTGLASRSLPAKALAQECHSHPRVSAAGLLGLLTDLHATIGPRVYS